MMEAEDSRAGLVLWKKFWIVAEEIKSKYLFEETIYEFISSVALLQFLAATQNVLQSAGRVWPSKGSFVPEKPIVRLVYQDDRFL